MTSLRLMYRHIGCLHLSQRRPPEMCGLLWTCLQMDLDPPRFLIHGLTTVALLVAKWYATIELPSAGAYRLASPRAILVSAVSQLILVNLTCVVMQVEGAEAAVWLEEPRCQAAVRQSEAEHSWTTAGWSQSAGDHYRSVFLQPRITSSFSFLACTIRSVKISFPSVLSLTVFCSSFLLVILTGAGFSRAIAFPADHPTAWH